MKKSDKDQDGTDRRQCEKCGEFLDTKKIVWLGFDRRVLAYTDKPIPQEHDQGGFPFGPACAKKQVQLHTEKFNNYIKILHEEK